MVFRIIHFLSHLCAGVFLLVFALPVHAQDSETLARDWCASCHLYPEPELLDRETWITSVLPNMGLRLGFTEFRGQRRYGDLEAPDGVYADEPLLTPDEWAAIIAWYEENAPEEMPLPTWQKREDLDLFQIERPVKLPTDSASAIAVMIDEQNQQLLISDSAAISLKIHDHDLNLLADIPAPGVISRILPAPDGTYRLVVIGETIEQLEARDGALLSYDPAAITKPITRLAGNLHRPVDVEMADFNNDGQLDYLVAGFGTHHGQLTLHLSQPDGQLAQSIVINEAGATSIEVWGDEVYVLMAQGNERIVKLSNLGTGSPKQETIMQFPAVYGSSSLQVLDFNQDGLADLLYTAGDNADISQILKPYHGIYLYLGQPDLSFKQDLFFHLDGTTNAVVEDFDLDGDLDIAAIAYYANISHGVDDGLFLFLENQTDGFTPHRIAGLGDFGRFIALAAGDVDGDGDKDIALVNLAFGAPGPMEMSLDLLNRWSSATRFILLRNQSN